MIDDVIQRPLFLSVNRGPQVMDMILKIRQVCEMKPSEEAEKQAKGIKQEQYQRTSQRPRFK